MAILMTSLAEIKSFNPCEDGWRRIVTYRGEGANVEELFPLVNCLDGATFSDVSWLIGKRQVEVSIVVEAAKKCADSVKHLKNDYAAAASKAAAAAATYATYAASNAAYAAADASNAARATYAAAARADTAAADAAAYADVADAADTAAYAAAYANATYANAAYNEQAQKNKNFLAQSIREYELK
jgi:hypothetical protein